MNSRLIVGALLSLGACSEAPQTTAPALPSTLAALAPLSETDIEARPLAGELACAFTAPAGVLLLARGVVASSESAEGLAKVGAALVRVTAPGGFDAMLDRATFTGEGVSLRVEVTGPATQGGESPARPAVLSASGDAVATATLPGEWTCGP